MTIKTDNFSLPTKLLLRRYFLDLYHPAGSTVFDSCQGSGQIWKRLRVGRPGIRYWGVDVKPARGRVKVDSERVLQIPGWQFDVIDVDTYGMPWGHWLAILANGRGPLTVFLTVGNITMGGSKLCAEVRAWLGMGDLKVPAAICGRLNGDFTLEHIGQASLRGWHIIESREAIPPRTSHARYFGVRLERTG